MPFPPPGDLPDLGIEPTSLVSSVLAGGFFTTEPPGNPPLLLGLPLANRVATSHSLRLCYHWGCPAPTELPVSPGLMPAPGRRGCPFLAPTVGCKCRVPPQPAPPSSCLVPDTSCWTSCPPPLLVSVLLISSRGLGETDGQCLQIPVVRSCNCDQFQVAHMAPLGMELGGDGWPSLLVGSPTPGM